MLTPARARRPRLHRSPRFCGKFERLYKAYPPNETDLSSWTNRDLKEMLEIIDLGDEVMQVFQDEEFFDGSDDDESAFGSIEVADLESMFENTGLDRELKVLSLCLQYLKGVFTNVSLRAT